MINLFENFDNASRDFLISQQIAKMRIPTIVMHDDGFLPESIDSPIKYFCELKSNHHPLYFDQVPIPHFWRIVGDANSAKVYDLKSLRANINYLKNDNTRIVREVQWLDENGNISWADEYDQHAFRYAQVFYENGQAIWKNYYNRQGHRVIQQSIQHEDIFIDYKNHKRHFNNYAQMTLYYLKLKNYNLNHIFYNTLNESLAVSLLLPADSGEDVLFWHEKLGDQLPGNMQFLISNKTRTKQIIFQNKADWENKQSLIPKNSDIKFQYLGMIYIHPRGNNLHSEALILTNSDQITQLAMITDKLPKIHFHIGAVTEMSDKLMAFGDRDNVSLYPNIRRSTLLKLLKNCDLYFDINQGPEILDAVRGAFEQNMLIVGFDNTLHEPKFINPKDIFSSDENGVNQMAKTVLSALVKPQLMGDLIDEQRAHAGDVWPKDYQRVLGAIVND